LQRSSRDHTEKGTGDQEPWVGGPEQEAIRRRFIETRYQLMPYLYTLAEEAFRTGLPLVRPLFVEFPEAVADRHPIDIDVPAAGEFLLGADLLIAPSPYPDETDAYTVEFPSSDWYNYWTGAKVEASVSHDNPDPTANPSGQPPLSIRVSPALAQLPVFVRGGSILPVAPVVQSTSETPQGPLTLRVYVGDQCSGELYQDDGKTYAYRRGVYLRMKFRCEKTPEGLHLKIGAHEGSYPAWWKDIHAEIYGWTPRKDEVVVNAGKIPAHIEHESARVGLMIEDNGTGADVQLQ
jgi:alpha-glucosidase